ncbi:ciliary microtubule-associated protein 3 isoform 3-T3 [Liasis olivaceus]
MSQLGSTTWGRFDLRTRLDFQQSQDAGWELSNVQKRNSFGSSQEKKIFPFFHAPDRLGNAYIPIKGDPDRGPGAYNHAERNNLIYNLANRPESTKGYTMGARTTPRFELINKHVTPAPTTYQSIWIKEHKHKTAHFPFHSSIPRFSEQTWNLQPIQDAPQACHLAREVWFPRLVFSTNATEKNFQS